MRVTFLVCVLLTGVSVVAKAQPYQYQISPPGKEVKMQSVLSYELPAYPLKAQKKRMQGSGRFRITLRQDGFVDSVNVTKSTGHFLLDQAGVAALREWRFVRGAPKIIRVPIVWTLGTIKEYAPKHPWRDPKTLGIGDGEWIIVSER